MPDPGSASGGEDDAAARRLLDAIGGQPRPAGSPAEAGARAHARGLLEAHGFVVREEPFSYSAFPGRWATSLSGLGAIGVIAVAGHLAALGSPWAALAVLATGLGTIAGAATWLARRGVLDAPLMRRQGVNLVATRSAPTGSDALPASPPRMGRSTHPAPASSDPALWVMAHLDSKSQPIPILVRAGAITLSVVLFLAAVGLALAQGLGYAGGEWWPALTIATVIALLPVAASIVGARSDGTIDNASGCAAVLLAACSLPPDAPLGVLLTSAEELGLAGARAFARHHPTGACVNCDGVDDSGRWTAMYTGRPPTGLLAGVERASRRLGMAVRPRRLLPGVLVDGVALADAGWHVITISHGSIATLSRIHTPRDSRDSLRGDAIPAGAALIAGVLNEVR